MNSVQALDSIPNDLFLEIFLKLNAKSIGMCCCVSKQWASILGGQEFAELFFTRSSKRPRLIIRLDLDNECLFSSLPHPENPYEKSCLVVASADFHMKISKHGGGLTSTYVSGLFYFHYTHNFVSGKDKVMICNPTTGEYALVPKLKSTSDPAFLGFDPIGKQFKLLSPMQRDNNGELVCYILTLGTEEDRWRKIQCPISSEYRNWFGGICFNGGLYYMASTLDFWSFSIVCFDVRSETFKSINLMPDFSFHYTTRLINYKGKLSVIDLVFRYDHGSKIDIRMWNLADVEKHEWSKYVYTFSAEDKVIQIQDNLFVAGVTATGDIVLSLRYARNPFYVFYLNPERNTFLSVEVQGVGEDRPCSKRQPADVFVDHLEDFRFDFMKTTSKTSERTFTHESVNKSEA